MTRAKVLALTILCTLSLASSASGVPSEGGATTCAYTTAGKRIGCVPGAYNCNNGFVTRSGSTLFFHEQYAPKDVESAEADTAAERVRPGLWSIVDLLPRREFIGRASATNAAKTRWRITNAHGRPVATARGLQGPQIAMVLLSRGADYFC